MQFQNKKRSVFYVMVHTCTKHVIIPHILITINRLI